MAMMQRMGPPPFSRHGPPGEDGNSSRDNKAIRSVFVANIAFETTEEQLRNVLSEVGPVINLKLIYDPASGRPRGFGFCEYEDTETAMSAVRNLAGRELNGRPLRIDSASNAPGEGFRMGGGGGGGPPLQGGLGGPIEPPPHGAPVPPESAPEAITKAVASLPPEQMFELMKQMKWSIQHNPQEARQLLLHNPQLAYALLQAQVVMRIVDLETAQNLLHRMPRGPSLHQPPPSQDRPPPHPQPPVGRGEGGAFGSPRETYGPPRGERFGGGPPPEHFGPRHPRGPPPHSIRGGPQGGSQYGGPPPRSHPEPRSLHPSSQSPSGGMSPQDQEKAALIMQVLSLSDEQIQMLPPDQRNSILKLKEQIAKTH